MTIQDLGSFGEFLSAIAVVLSLLYVAKQVRDNSKQTQRNTATVMAAIAQDGFSPLYTTPENIRIWHVGRLRPEELTSDELETFFMFMTRQIFNYENAVSAYEEGTYEEDLFMSQSTYYGSLINTPGGRLWLDKGDMPVREKSRKYLGVT
jgi:hypothetical protein